VDPKNTDYAAELGASRNFEPRREEKAIEEEDVLAKLEEEENNPMKALENRAIDSKHEMDILDTLHDICTRNARNERVGQLEDLVVRIGHEEVVSPKDEQRRGDEGDDEKPLWEVFSKVSVPGVVRWMKDRILRWSLPLSGRRTMSNRISKASFPRTCGRW